MRKKRMKLNSNKIYPLYGNLFNTIQDGADGGILKIKISELEIYKISRNIIPSKNHLQSICLKVL